MYQGTFGEWVVATLCATRGYSATKVIPDMDGVDLTVKKDRFTIDLAVKTEVMHRATAEAGTFAYDLAVGAYDQMRSFERTVPLVLVVLPVPPEEAAWMRPVPGGLMLRFQPRWADLRGSPETVNKKSVRVSMCAGRTLTPLSVDRMVEEVFAREP